MDVLWADLHIAPPSKTMILLRHVLASLWQRRLRSFLGMLGVACGVILFLAPVAIEEGAKQKTLAQIEQLGIKNILVKASRLNSEQERSTSRRGSYGLTLSDAERIKHWVSNVEEIAAVREVTASFYAERNEKSPQILAVTHDYANVQGLQLAKGRFIVAGDVYQNHSICVIGHRLELNMSKQEQESKILRIGDRLCQIVGVLSHFDKKSGGNIAISPHDFDNIIFVPLENQSGSNLPIAVNELIIRIRTANGVMSAVPNIQRAMSLMHNGVDDYQIIVPQQLLKQADQAQITFNIVLWSISIIGFLVGGLGIMNIMLANVMERTREIGIRRALGAKREDILLQFIVEALVLSLAGSLMGIALGFAGVWVISSIADWELVVTPLVFSSAFLMPVLTGIFFGFYPALRAADMSPIAALRHE